MPAILAVLAVLVGGLLSGCVAGPTPANLAGGAWQTQQRAPAERSKAMQAGTAISGARCSVAAATRDDSGSAARQVDAAAFTAGPPPLSPGDRVRLRVLGDDHRLTGAYVIGPDGRLTLPDIGAIDAAGLDEMTLGARLTRLLVDRRQIRSRDGRALAGAVDIRLIESVGAVVSVSGAVFEPGTVRAGERSGEDRAGQRDIAVSGDANGNRTLSAAIRAAGGIRPDADPAHVTIIRGDRWATLDLSADIAGTGESDVQLARGDRVVVGSTGCFDARWVRPSSLTMSGVRVFMSNLSRPSNTNAGAGVGKESSSLPYGTRLLQALVSMNCVGGSAMNAGRRAVLMSRNPVNGQSIVIERQVEALVRGADRDADDPYLMPGDAIACYDSRWMNLTDAVALVGSTASIATPAILLSRSTR